MNEEVELNEDEEIELKKLYDEFKSPFSDNPTEIEDKIKETGMKRSEILKKVYLKSGLSYDKMAKQMGVKRNTLANWLIGRRQPSRIILEYACVRLDIDLNDLLCNCISQSELVNTNQR